MSSNCFVSLFTGAGGLDIGLESAGWVGRYASDNDPVTIDTLNANRGRLIGDCRYFEHAAIELADVQKLTGDHILAKIGATRGEIPLLVGGPPCQSWSSAGRQLGFNDPRGRLFSDFVRLAVELGVRWVMFENVRGLLTARGMDGRPGTALEQIRCELLDVGFQTSVALLNAADYGVAQRRVRLVVFAYRDSEPFEFPLPTHDKHATGSLAPWHSLRELFASNPVPDESDVIRPSELLATQLAGLPEGSGVKSPGKREATRPGGHWGYKQGAFVTDPSKPARTVTANTQQDWYRDPAIGLRRLSPRECSAIQSFPEGWLFSGRRSDQYRQIGNAVPPKLGEALGSALLDHMSKANVLPASHARLTPLSSSLESAVRYTERDHLRNGASRSAAPDRRSRRAA